MNANISRRIALLTAAALTGILAGCTASASFGLQDDPNQTAQLISRQPAREPNFSSQRTPVMMQESSSNDSLSPGLVGLYGELQKDWPETAGTWDGSSNVSQITFASEGGG